VTPASNRPETRPRAASDRADVRRAEATSRRGVPY
jgi:hypothetical protein